MLSLKNLVSALFVTVLAVLYFTYESVRVPPNKIQTADLEYLLSENKDWKKRVYRKGCQIFFEEQPNRSCIVKRRPWRITTTFNLRHLVDSKKTHSVAEFDDYDLVLLFFSQQTRTKQQTEKYNVQKIRSGHFDLEKSPENKNTALPTLKVPSQIIQLCSKENRIVPLNNVGESFFLKPGKGKDFVNSIYQLRNSCELDVEQ